MKSPLLLAMSLTVPAAVHAQTQPYPQRPVRVIVNVSAGGGVDILARIVGAHLGGTWGHPFVIDNRTGAGGAIGTEIAAKGAPDGYTLLVSSSTVITTAAIRPQGYDPVRDFQAVTLLASAPFYLMTHPSLPVKTVKELTALAKARPGQLNYGSSGLGTPPHMAAEMYKSMAGINVVHVPYKTVAAAVTDQIAGQIQVSFQYGPSSLPVVRAGRLRGLAVSSAKRSRFAPELPTMDEAGVPGYEIIGWNGIHVPLKTPPDMLNKLNTDLRQALQAPEVQERLTAASLDIHGHTRAEFEAFVNKDRARWAKVVKDAGITPE